MVCNENQPRTTSETPNIDNPYEDYLETREEMMDNYDDDYE
jgi:hypothetical protein